MAKTKKKKKKTERPDTVWDKLLDDAVLDVVAGARGRKYKEDAYENINTAVMDVETVVRDMSRRLKERSGLALRVRRENASSTDASMHLLIIDPETQGIIERAATLVVTASAMGQVAVYQTGGRSCESIAISDMENILAEMLLSVGSPLREFVIWKLNQQQKNA